MEHDWTKYFDTSLEEWIKLQDLYKENDGYPKIIVSGRNLHHKFLRCFSKKEGTPVDNDKDNLVSLSEGDHFLAHYYIWKCTKKGFRHYTALPVNFMYKKAFKTLTEESALVIRDNWIKSKNKFTNKKLIEFNHSRKGISQSEEHKQKVRESRKKYDVPIINVQSFEVLPQRNQKAMFFDTENKLSNANSKLDNIWIRQSEIEKINKIFKTDFYTVSFEERIEILKLLNFIKSYYEKDPDIINRIKEELDKWY